MLHEHVEIRHAAVRMPANNLQLNLTESNPLWNLGPTQRRAVMIPSGLLNICPIPGHVQGLEIDFRTLPTQSARIGLHAKQCVLSNLSTRNVDQQMTAWYHQIESLAMHILHMGVTNGRTRRWNRREYSCGNGALYHLTAAIRIPAHPTSDERPTTQSTVAATRAIVVIAHGHRVGPDRVLCLAHVRCGEHVDLAIAVGICSSIVRGVVANWLGVVGKLTASNGIRLGLACSERLVNAVSQISNHIRLEDGVCLVRVEHVHRVLHAGTMTRGSHAGGK
mmetsp:Transcript_47896/g.129206  ORF Transcript_47896/g.129206 Transcript_47896/m.129206 type:complete len:278 (-) Transcript_47896:150-983(-)